MNYKSQQHFEDSVILESELGAYITSDGEELHICLDTLNEKYMTLDYVISDSLLNDKNRGDMLIYIGSKIDSLTANQKKIAYMKFVLSMTYQQISDKLNIPLSTIHKRFQKILKIIQ